MYIFIYEMLCNILKRLLKMSEKTQLTTFNNIIEVVLQHEGGYVNDPKDLGGETKYGILKGFIQVWILKI